VLEEHDAQERSQRRRACACQQKAGALVVPGWKGSSVGAHNSHYPKTAVGAAPQLKAARVPRMSQVQRRVGTRPCVLLQEHAHVLNRLVLARPGTHRGARATACRRSLRLPAPSRASSLQPQLLVAQLARLLPVLHALLDLGRLGPRTRTGRLGEPSGRRTVGSRPEAGSCADAMNTVVATEAVSCRTPKTRRLFLTTQSERDHNPRISLDGVCRTSHGRGQVRSFSLKERKEGRRRPGQAV
jgi:hypothetical protein